MTAKPLDDVMRRVLNDPDIFSPPYDSKTKSPIPWLFEKTGWQKLKGYFDGEKKAEFDTLINNRVAGLRREEKNSREPWRKKKIDEVISLGESFKEAYEKKRYFLKELFNTMDSFGLIECKLPNMEDYGKVIENHGWSTVEHYFLSKIDRASDYQKRALRKTLEYLKELHAMDIDILEMAFFIRKLNSLTQFVEVIRDE